MANTKAAQKAIRSSEKKRQHNLFWKRRIYATKKNLNKLLSESKVDLAILKEQEVLLQKVVDKASKANVIHKNKANRIKSRFAKKIAAHEKKGPKTTKSKKPTAKSSTKKS